MARERFPESLTVRVSYGTGARFEQAARGLGIPFDPSIPWERGNRDPCYPKLRANLLAAIREEPWRGLVDRRRAAARADVPTRPPACLMPVASRVRAVSRVRG